jgi:hypothetical protein
MSPPPQAVENHAIDAAIIAIVWLRRTTSFIFASTMAASRAIDHRFVVGAPAKSERTRWP